MEYNCDSVECIATHEDYKGKGIALAIVTHICSNTTYDEFVLEVANTNIPAVQLCKKIGLNEFRQVALSHKARKESGVNHLVYMKYKK